ncbi:MAG: hypothetical protein HY735_10700 [Verrucomicrobia bacterium]|nr:hypothetical protein [Verrucomicrobiota bacterium]
MYKTIPGTYRSGVVQLTEPPPDLPEGPVLVTFLNIEASQANAPALEPEQIAELRGKLAAWEADWNAPGMEVYDKP